MKKRIITLVLTIAMLATFFSATASVSASAVCVFPFDLEGPFEEWNAWVPPEEILSSAEIMVVEHEGTLTEPYYFLRQWPTPTMAFNSWDDSGKTRITEEPGKLIFDLRELEGLEIVFGPNGDDIEKIKRVYLDILPVAPNLSPRAIYVDASNIQEGDGSKANPYKSLVTAASAALSGDIILVADGIYHGALSLRGGTAERPTILKAAAGARPVITPTIPFEANWSVYKDNIYVADVSEDIADAMETEFPQLFVDGISMIEARYPNLTGSDMSFIMEQERLVMQHGSNTNTVVSPVELPPDLIGATVIVWPGDESGGWSTYISPVLSVDGKTITLEKPISSPQWPCGSHIPTPGNPFYITGALSLLDAPGEYYYDREKRKFYFCTPNGEDPTRLNLTLKTKDRYAINMSYRHNAVVDGFDIYGGGINMIFAQNCTVQNSRIRYFDHFYIDDERMFFGKWEGEVHIPWRDGFEISGNNNTITRCEIGPTAGHGIRINGGSNHLITDNIMHSANYSGSSFAGISTLYSHHLEISNNFIFDSGQNHIQFEGWEDYHYSHYRNIIRNNHLDNPAILTNDNGAIYIHGSNGGDTEIYNNFIRLGRKGGWGEMTHIYQVGIYPDNGSINFIIHNNIIISDGVGYESMGISINMPNEGHQVYNNTIVGGKTGIASGHFLGTSKDDFVITTPSVIRDNLTVGTSKAYGGTYMLNGEKQFFEGDFKNGEIPVSVNEYISSGNASGTIDEFFRPTGDTPNVGAVLREEEMFEYGATWELSNLPYSDGLIPDYADLNLVYTEPTLTPAALDNTKPSQPELPSASPDQPDDNPILWIIFGGVGIVIVAILVIVIVRKRK